MGAIVMLGDSLTEYNRWDELAPEREIINLGWSGDTAMGVYFRLGQVTRAKPTLIFLQVGINDLGQGRSPEAVALAHEKIWAALADQIPYARLVVQSLAPIRATKFAWEAITLNNPQIQKTNRLLAEAAQKAGLDFLDLYAALVGPDGELPDPLTDDGVHLTSAAYEIWLKLLKDFLGQASD
ncbi:MAG: GDSL-type esterase/lipase family protein [Deltaproteobacteria bacterium]|jgi:lysophospholipase L1-like esterase|nr:GDSL-type esterase/lipase family protein [Deltaproteobacteria bacterium]